MDRKSIAVQANKNLKAVFAALVEECRRGAPNAYFDIDAIFLGDIMLSYSIPFPYLERRSYVGSSKWDILAGGYIGVEKSRKVGMGAPMQRLPSRSANLWFRKLVANEDEYGWREVCYVAKNRQSFIERKWEPFGFEFEPPKDEDHLIEKAYPNFHRPKERISIADIAELAEDPLSISHEFELEFINRWMTLFSLMGLVLPLTTTLPIFAKVAPPL